MAGKMGRSMAAWSDIQKVVHLAFPLAVWMVGGWAVRKVCREVVGKAERMVGRWVGELGKGVVAKLVVV